MEEKEEAERKSRKMEDGRGAELFMRREKEKKRRKINMNGNRMNAFRRTHRAHNHDEDGGNEYGIFQERNKTAN